LIYQPQKSATIQSVERSFELSFVEHRMQTFDNLRRVVVTSIPSVENAAQAL
jgi:hypothetical protein